MKNILKVLGFTALIAVIGFSMAACGGDDIGYPTDGFTTIDAFGSWLKKQPTNTPETAYNVKLNVSSLGGDVDTEGSVKKLLNDNSTKYVSLDLSGSTFTNIDDSAFYDCQNLTSITIPNSVKSIGDGAFSGCTSLASVTIPDIRKTARFT